MIWNEKHRNCEIYKRSTYPFWRKIMTEISIEVKWGLYIIQTKENITWKITISALTYSGAGVHDTFESFNPSNKNQVSRINKRIIFTFDHTSYCRWTPRFYMLNNESAFLTCGLRNSDLRFGALVVMTQHCTIDSIKMHCLHYWVPSGSWALHLLSWIHMDLFKILQCDFLIHSITRNIFIVIFAFCNNLRLKIDQTFKIICIHGGIVNLLWTFFVVPVFSAIFTRLWVFFIWIFTMTWAAIIVLPSALSSSTCSSRSLSSASFRMMRIFCNTDIKHASILINMVLPFFFNFAERVSNKL